MDTRQTLTAAEVIDRVRAARDHEHQAAITQLEMAVEWARLHPCPADEWPAHWGDPRLDEQVVPIAGPGAPLVAEWAPVELAAQLGLTADQGRRLVGEGLELTHRLTRLWTHTKAGLIPVWKARAIAALTYDLGPDAVAYADRLLAATPDKLRLVDATRLVDEARLYFDPDRAAADEEHELTKRGVWVKHTAHPATTDVFMTLDTLDAAEFNAMVSILAAELAACGDTDPVDVRRAKAVGILADPQRALGWLTRPEGGTPTPMSPTRPGVGAMNLYLHLTPEDLLGDQVGAVSIEKLGAATTQLLTDWLARQTEAGGRITLRPVLDLSQSNAVDQHDPPAAMRELVLLRDAHCVFPGCRHDSRGCDLDHITPYIPMDEGGPPRQTHLGNLAPLCRTHHRIKTHTAWDYKRTDDGTYTWTTPTGHQYDVDPVSRRPPPQPTHRRT